MRYIRYAFLAVIGVALLTIGIANREFVTLELLPKEIAEFAGWNASVSLPLFIVIFGGVVAGLAIGFALEWLREHKHRAAARENRRARERLEAEVDRLKPPEKDTATEVLAILDNPKTAS